MIHLCLCCRYRHRHTTLGEQNGNPSSGSVTSELPAPQTTGESRYLGVIRHSHCATIHCRATCSRPPSRVTTPSRNIRDSEHCAHRVRLDSRDTVSHGHCQPQYVMTAPARIQWPTSTNQNRSKRWLGHYCCRNWKTRPMEPAFEFDRPDNLAYDDEKLLMLEACLGVTGTAT